MEYVYILSFILWTIMTSAIFFFFWESGLCPYFSLSSVNQDSLGLKWIVLRLNNILIITMKDSKESWRITNLDIDHPFFGTIISFREKNLIIFLIGLETSSLIIRKSDNNNSYFLKSKGLSSVIKDIISYW